MKIFCSDWPYLIRNHLSFLFLRFVLKYLQLNWIYDQTLVWSMQFLQYSDIFLDFVCLRKYWFYFSLLNLNYWCFTTILRKFQKNLFKIFLEFTYPTDLCTICILLTCGKKWKWLIFLNQWLELNLFCAKVVTTNGFALNHDEGLQIYFFCLKRQTKKKKKQKKKKKKKNPTFWKMSK